MKKNILTILSATVLGLMLSACEQDPMAKKSAELRNAKPISDLPQKPEPIESNAIQMTAPDSVTFAESVKGNFFVTAKTLKDGYEKVTLEIENLEEFEGATPLDPVTGEFVWTPKKGIVRNGNFQQYNLSIRAYALPKDPKGQILTRSRQVRVDVNRTFTTPTITKVENFPRTIREGERKEFYVEVVDFDSGADANDIPQVQFLDPAQSDLNMSSTVQLITSGIQFFPLEKRWRFRYEMNLRGVEATSSSTLFSLGLRVVNKFGSVSTRNEFEGRVFTKLSSLESNWESDLTLKPSIQQTVTFLVYDPKGEANIEYKETSFNGPKGSTLVCKGSQVKVCDFIVTPQGKVGETDYQTFKFEFTSSNKDVADTKIETKRFYFSYYVEPLPTQPRVSVATGVQK